MSQAFSVISETRKIRRNATMSPFNKEKHSTGGCEELTNEKVDLLNKWFTCQAPVNYQKKTGIGKAHYVTGRTILKKKPWNGLEQVSTLDLSF